MITRRRRATPHGGSSGRRLSLSTRFVLSVVAFLLGAIALIPIVWTVSLSIRTNDDVFSNEILPHSFRIQNYRDSWDMFGLGVLFEHTLIVTAATVVITLVLATAAAYGFSRYRTRISDGVFVLILTGLMIPPAAVIIPFFLLMRELSLYNSLLAVIMGESAFALPFGILLLRGYIENVPVEITDAARVDGASDLQAFWYVAVPLLRPALATVALFTTIWAWNGFLLPLVLINDPVESTVTVGLSRLQNQFGSLNLELMSAAAVLAIVPILLIFVISRRYYVRGVTAGAIKS